MENINHIQTARLRVLHRFVAIYIPNTNESLVTHLSDEQHQRVVES